ncbi:hypothetical protein EDC96DRAFT_526870 [Choanephora cucurbitarum]|nr:hypothetical protein EDC96DRAFT_526870 [Choanephora cucurbitarum]
MTGSSRSFDMTPTVQQFSESKSDYTQAVDSEEDMGKRPLKRKRHHQSSPSSLLANHSYPTTMNLPHKMTSQRSVPAFLHKLFNMVGDPSTNQLVRWSKDGNSFLVEGHERFAKHVLPRFYKHNTFASFVRQLNMYDFHKIPHLQQGALVSSSGTENEVWEFSHPHFQRNRPDLLVLVSRKRNKDRDKPNADQMNLGSLVKEITAIRKHQANITADLRNLHHDNEIIWRETLAAREKFQKHQQVISKILQFLSAVFSDDQNMLYELSNQKDFLNNNSLQLPDNKGEVKSKFNKFVASHEFSHRSKFNKDSDNQHGNSEKGAASSDSGIGSADSSGNNSSEDDAKSSQVSPKDLKQKLINPKLFSDNTARSAEAITCDINELQENVELLAAQLGIDPLDLNAKSNEVEKFSDNHINMISSASQDDKRRLFKLASEDDRHIPPHRTLGHPYHLTDNFLVQPENYPFNSQHPFVQQVLKQEHAPSPTTAETPSNNNNNMNTQQPLVNTNPLPMYVATQSLVTGSLPVHQPSLATNSNMTMNHLFDPSFRQRDAEFHHTEPATMNPEFCHTAPIYRNKFGMADYVPYYDASSSTISTPPLLQQHGNNSLHSSTIVPTSQFSLMYPAVHMNASQSSARMKDTVGSKVDQDK